MPDIGVRELKTRASEIIRDLREQRTRYVVTYRGRVGPDG
jgi:antitoxin (DNA-binding transcriptional repressor) of toxin-antitoxin stability system